MYLIGVPPAQLEERLPLSGPHDALAADDPVDDVNEVPERLLLVRQCDGSRLDTPGLGQPIGPCDQGYDGAMAGQKRNESSDVILRLELDIQDDRVPRRRENSLEATLGGRYRNVNLESLQIEAKGKALGHQ